jgi:hypothetical protein
MIVAAWFELSISKTRIIFQIPKWAIRIRWPQWTNSGYDSSVPMSHFVDMVCSHCRTRVTETHTRAKHSKQREQDWLVSLSKLYDTSKNVCFFSSNYHGLCLNVSRDEIEEHNCPSRHEIPSWWLPSKRSTTAATVIPAWVMQNNVKKSDKENPWRPQWRNFLSL